jgi:hypothetical protein
MSKLISISYKNKSFFLVTNTNFLICILLAISIFFSFSVVFDYLMYSNLDNTNYDIGLSLTYYLWALFVNGETDE